MRWGPGALQGLFSKGPCPIHEAPPSGLKHHPEAPPPSTSAGDGISASELAGWGEDIQSVATRLPLSGFAHFSSFSPHNNPPSKHWPHIHFPSKETEAQRGCYRSQGHLASRWQTGMGPGSLDSELLLTTRAGTRVSAQGTQAAKLRETSLSGLCGCRVSA